MLTTLRSGDVVVMQVTEAGIVPVQRFAGGHSSVIRSFYWNAAANMIVTGGEDSRICLWGPTPPAQPPTIPSPARDGKVRLFCVCVCVLLYLFAFLLLSLRFTDSLLQVARKEGKKASYKPY